jgi:hypothetical protein
MMDDVLSIMRQAGELWGPFGAERTEGKPEFTLVFPSFAKSHLAARTLQAHGYHCFVVRS